MRLRYIRKQLYSFMDDMRLQHPARWLTFQSQHMQSNKVTAFVDCSGRGDGYFGLGVCLVVNGHPHVHSEVLADMAHPTNTVAGELWAVHRALKFVLDRSQDIISHSDSLTIVDIYSDLNVIGNLLNHTGGAKRELQYVITEIHNMKRRLEHDCNAEVRILYLDPNGQSGNPLYKAAHQAARMAAHSPALKITDSKVMND